MEVIAAHSYTRDGWSFNIRCVCGGQGVIDEPSQLCMCDSPVCAESRPILDVTTEFFAKNIPRSNARRLSIPQPHPCEDL